MTPERWRKITEVYHSALELEATEKIAFLDKACADDESLRREVESLLAADSEAESFIAEPVVKDFASFLSNETDRSLSGKKLGHYQILSRLGKGGMGEVYLAKDLRLNRSVALKTLPVSFAGNQTYLQRFQTEAKAAATLNHPHVATIYSVEEVDGISFITMEYVKGKTLDEFILGSGLDLKIFLEWFVDISDALSHAHEKGVIHRDIKPHNIMITEDGLPKVLDFGLAQIDKTKLNDNSSTLRMTQPGQIFGTPSYMSPEQAEGKPADYRSDIFSLGVVMYEAITGERPFKGDSYASVVSELMTKEPRSISEINPEMPFLLTRLIERCLKKERRRRFQSMSEVRVILEEIKAAVEAGVSLHGASIQTWSNSGFFSRRSGLAAAVLFLASIMGFAIYYLAFNKSAAPINFENITLRKLSQSNDVVYAQITPDGKSVAYNTINEDETRSLWIRRVEEKNALLLLPPQPVHFWGGLTISADGNHIFYITAGKDARHGTLYRISSLGGTPRKIVETVNDAGSLSPDGSKILYVRYGEEMQILSANSSDGSQERVIYAADANYIFRDPQFSQDGKSIFFIKFKRISGEEFWSLIRFFTESGEEKVIIPFRKPRISEIAVLTDGSGLLVNAVDEASNLQQIFYISLPDYQVTRVTNDLNDYFGISVSDDGKKIITAQRSTAKDIWITSAGDFENFRKLTNESNIYTGAAFTPDGRIVFDATDNNRPHIWIMNDDGSSPQQLTPGDSTDFEPQISPDGRYIVFTSERTGERKVWRMNIDGSNPQLLTQKVNGAAYNPAITPDGQNVFFLLRKESSVSLGKVPLAGGEVSEQTPFSERHWALSPDNTQVAYTFYDEQNKQYKVGVRPLDKNEPTAVFSISPAHILMWSPDGKGLLYRNIDESGYSSSIVWFQPISGGEPKQFLSVKPDAITSLSQSTDGKKMLVVKGKLITDAVMLSRMRDDK